MIVTLDNFRTEIADKKRAAQIRRRALSLLHFWTSQDPKLESLVVLCGLPGAGKSTWAKQNDRDSLLIYDACNLTSESRLAALQTAAHLTTHIVFLQTPYDVCVTRNFDRRDAVPSGLMRWMCSALVPPTEAEADRVSIVESSDPVGVKPRST